MDGWGYYRIQLPISDDWRHEKTFLNFNGVDDYYELSVDGETVGTGGDLANRFTAFDERKSHDISKFVRPGKNLTIAVKVLDWQGAGGIFRPVSLTNQPEDDQPRLLR